MKITDTLKLGIEACRQRDIEIIWSLRMNDIHDAFIADGNLLAARWGTPEDIGKAVAALVRGDLPYATGAVITQDGGLGLPRL